VLVEAHPERFELAQWIANGLLELAQDRVQRLVLDLERQKRDPRLALELR
jgi:hypothetical protein